MALTTKQALKILNESDQNYIHHYIAKSTIHDGCGDELGEINMIVFKRLKESGKIEYFAESTMLISNGYFKLSAAGKI
jgi:hypothetical protein